MADKEYDYELIDNEHDARCCAQLLADEFAAHNPITVFDRISSQRFYHECAWPLTSEVLDERMSFLVRHRSSNEIVGAALAGDLYLQHQKKCLRDTSNQLHTIPVDDLLDEMDTQFIAHDFDHELRPNIVLHISLCAVHAQHSGRGVASRLRTALCDYARDRKQYQFVLVQVTNPVTRHIFVDKMGGRETSVVDPTTWTWKKHGDGSSRPYKDYQGGSIPNILIRL